MKKNIYELIQENKNLIYKIAYSFSGFTNVEDLFQVGCIGLIKAHSNFKEKFNAKFSTYAYTYILGEITTYLKNDRLFKIGSDNYKLCKLYEKAKDYLTNLNSRIPSFSEIADFMEVDRFELYNALSNNFKIESMDKEISEDLSLLDVIGTDETKILDEKLDLANSLNNLCQKEKMLINFRYYQDYTQSETATLMGMSQVQVSRAENKILKKMKKEMVH